MGEPHFLRASGKVFMYFQIVTNLGIQPVFKPTIFLDFGLGQIFFRVGQAR